MKNTFNNRKAIRNRAISLLLALIMLVLIVPPTPVSASSGIYDDFEYRDDGGYITITGYIGSGGAITIPANIDGKPVTHIGEQAFYSPQGLDITSVIIPYGVTDIEWHAFFNCNKMTNVTIPNSVERIGVEAFRSCIELTSVTIPSSVTNIGSGAFYVCSKLFYVHFESSVPPVADGWTFGSMRWGAKAIVPSGATAYGSLSTSSSPGSVWNGLFVTSASRGTFGDFEYLDEGASITIASYNGNANEVTIPSQINGKPVTYIGEGSFYYPYSLSMTSITIPSSVTYIGAYAFRNCGNLYDVYFDSFTPPTVAVPEAFSLIKSGARAHVPNGATAYGSAGSRWNGLVVTYMAQPTNVAITWDYNGGTGTQVTSSLTPGSAFGTLPTPNTRAGFTFNGWFTATTGGTQITATSAVPNTSTTYYARWTATHVPVTSITGVPTTATAGTPLALTGTANPTNATNKTIAWSVVSAGTTGATISGNTLNTTAAGTVTVRATITNGLTATTPYTQNFNITVAAAHVPVTSITGVPTTATAGTPLALTGTVNPANATNKTITWSIFSAGTTGATINGNTLNTTAAGTVTVRATITNGLTATTPYTQNFNITVAAAHVPVTSITGVPTTATAGTPLTLTGTVNPANATNKTIAWSVVSTGTTGATISGNTLNTTAAGTVTVRATITNGLTATTPYTQNFTITVNIVPVTSITGVPTTATAGTPLALAGTVNPANATNKTITWSVVNAGTTGATISGNTLNTTAAGTVTVRATITNGLTATTPYTQNFTITVNIVPVTSITGVPTTATAGTPLTLTGTVNPTNATNKTITWSLVNAGTTGATISGSTLNTTAAGTVTVRATITNGLTATTPYTQNFTITVNIVPVTSITGVPMTATARTPLTLTGTVNPANATNKTITWSLVSAGTTGATISGSTLNTTAAGTVTVRATITNGLTTTTPYTQDFTITVAPARAPFTMGIDNYRFVNTRASFSNNSNYSIPPERFEEIFPLSWVPSYHAAFLPWGGNCFGFATSAYAFKSDKLMHADYPNNQTNVTTTYGFLAPGNPSRPLTQLIELYQISQFLPNVNYARGGNHPNYNNLRALVEAADNNDSIIVIIRGAAGGHAVNAYGVDKLSETRYSIKIYDNNQPNNTNLRIDVDLSRSGSSAWSFNSADTQNYNVRLADIITFVDGEFVYNEIVSARNNQTYGASGMQINVPANAEITDTTGTSVETLNGAYIIYPLGVLPLNPDGTDPTPQRTSEMWFVPEGEYRVTVDGTENTSISVLDEGSAYAINLIPSGDMVTVEISDTLSVEGAAHGSVTVYQDSGAELLLPIIAGSVAGLSSDEGVEVARFDDVRANDWFEPAVTSMSSSGVVLGVGDNRYDPQGRLTVAQWVAMLMRTQHGQMPGGSPWYTTYIAQAERDGVLYGSDNLDPNAEITRAQMALITTRFIERFNPIWAKERVTTTPIDIATVPNVYRSAVEKAYAWNIVRGDNENRFNPNRTLTRAEAAQVLFNYFRIVD